jgi:RNA polymerase sigma-70 factor, ECF subfamily
MSVLKSNRTIDSPSVASEEQLCRTYASRIRGYGLRHLRDAAAAEDLVQHVLLAVLQAVRAGTIENPERLGAYVLGTCRYAVRDMQRGAARQRKIAEQNAAALPDGYEPSWPRVARERLEHCLMALDERARAIVLATFAYEHDTDEIGRAFELSPGNVRVVRHRALAKLQTCIEGAP